MHDRVREEAGELRLPQVATFLGAYQRNLVDEHVAGPLSAAELALIPHMLSASNILVLNRAVEGFYCKEVDPVEYRVFLQHGIGLMEWHRDRDTWQALEQVIAGTAIPASQQGV